MEIVVGIDNDPDAARTFQVNFPEAVSYCADIRLLPTRALDAMAAGCGNHPVLFSACAPCQPFSKQRRGPTLPGDKRFGLLGQLLRFVKRLKPELIFVENVPGLRDGSLREGAFLRFTRTIAKLGYDAEWRVVCAQDYGVPQRRARLLLLASKFGPVSFPGRSHGPGAEHESYATVRDWIGAIPPLAAGAAHPDVPNHHAAGLSPTNLARIRATPEGGGWRDWPLALVPDCHRGSFRGYSDVYGRMRWDAPASGLTTRCISYSNGRFGHPSQDRAITIREAARLQTFSNTFTFTGSLASQARQVGNAVPVLLAQRFGEHLAGFARGLTQPPQAPGGLRVHTGATARV